MVLKTCMLNSTQLVTDLDQGRQNNLKLFETRKPKALDGISKLIERNICLKEENIIFFHNYIIQDY